MRRAAAMLARTWRYLGWEHLAIALAAGTLISLSVALGTLHLNLERKHLWVAQGIRWYSVFAGVFVVVVAFVEANAPRRRPPLRNYAAAALVAAAICLAGAYALADVLLTTGYRRTTPNGGAPKVFTAEQRRPTAVFALGFDGVMHCVIGLFVYVRLRNARLTAMSLQRRQMRAGEASREEASERLESVSRRVDPESLTRTLDEIEVTYGVDPARADARLDELIEHLRAAIPKTRAQELGPARETAMEASR